MGLVFMEKYMIKMVIIVLNIAFGSVLEWDYVESNAIYNQQVCQTMVTQSSMLLEDRFLKLKDKLKNMNSGQCLELYLYTNFLEEYILVNYNIGMKEECINMQITPLQNYFIQLRNML